MKNLFTHPAAIIVITILSGLLLLSMRRTAQKSQVSSQNVQSMERRINQLTGELEQEQRALEYESSPFAQEKILRDELLLRRPGEYVIQIPDEGLVMSAVEEVETKSAWEQWRELLLWENRLQRTITYKRACDGIGSI